MDNRTLEDLARTYIADALRGTIVVDPTALLNIAHGVLMSADSRAFSASLAVSEQELVGEGDVDAARSNRRNA